MLTPTILGCSSLDDEAAEVLLHCVDVAAELSAVEDADQARRAAARRAPVGGGDGVASRDLVPQRQQELHLGVAADQVLGHEHEALGERLLRVQSVLGGRLRLALGADDALDVAVSTAQRGPRLLRLVRAARRSLGGARLLHATSNSKGKR